MLQHICLSVMVLSLCKAQPTTLNEENSCICHEHKLSTVIDTFTKSLAETRDLYTKYETHKSDPTTMAVTTASSEDHPLPKNCADIQRQGHTKSGVYTVYTCKHVYGAPSNDRPIKVFCDLETDNGGWLVIQKRFNGSESFLRTWNDYKEGFGRIDKEFWLGNENIHQILNSCNQKYDVRFDLEDFLGSIRNAKYYTFNVYSEASKYQLSAGSYAGTAGDSLPYSNGRQFTTMDVDHDIRPGDNCAKYQKGAWWYGNCAHAHINGLYLRGKLVTDRPHQGMLWTYWNGGSGSLKKTEMKIRPKTS